MEKYIELIEDSEIIDPETKLIALSEIDRMQRGEIRNLYNPDDNLGCAFIWQGTENGRDFWEDIYNKVYGEG